MEIRRYQDIKGVVLAEAIVEGRMVILTNHSFDHDFGSRTDLPAVRLPNDATEAARARYCLTFAVDNAQPPIYQPYPAFSYALRQGFDQSSNVPFSATVHLTQPGLKEGQTVPSGALGLAFGEGVYTVPSGAFVYNAAMLVPGTFLIVGNEADHGADAGKLRYSNGAASPIQVVEFDLTNHKLTFEILY